MKKLYAFMLVVLPILGSAQEISTWTRRLESRFGIATVGCAELTPGVYTVFGNSCSDSLCTSPRQFRLKYSEEGVLLDSQQITVPTGHLVVSVSKDEHGLFWLETRNQTSTRAAWHQLNHEGQLVKSFSIAFPSGSPGLPSDTVYTQLFRYPFGWYVTKAFNENSSGWEFNQLDISDTNQVISLRFNLKDTVSGGKFHYLRNGNFLLTRTITREWNSYYYATKYTLDGQVVFNRQISSLNRLTLWNFPPTDSTISAPGSATEDCSGNIWVNGSGANYYGDVQERHGWYMQKINGTTGASIQIYPFIGCSFNPINRPIYYDCSNQTFNTNFIGSFAYNSIFLRDMFSGWFRPGISEYPSSSAYEMPQIPNGGIAPIENFPELPYSHLLFRTSDGGYLLTTQGRRRWVPDTPNPMPIAQYANFPHSMVIKFDSMGFTTRLPLEISKSKVLQAIPNPATESFRLIGLDKPGKSEIIVYDLKGVVRVKLFASDLSNQPISISHLPKGLYVVKVNHATGSSHARFAKE